MTAKKVGPELIACLAEMADLDLPEDSLIILAQILNHQLKYFRDLPRVELTEVDLEMTFDPRWEL